MANSVPYIKDLTTGKPCYKASVDALTDKDGNQVIPNAIQSLLRLGLTTNNTACLSKEF